MTNDNELSITFDAVEHMDKVASTIRHLIRERAFQRVADQHRSTVEVADIDAASQAAAAEVIQILNGGGKHNAFRR